MKTTMQILKDARRLVANGWCQDSYWTDKEQGPTKVRCYCVLGALGRASDRHDVVDANGQHVQLPPPGWGRTEMQTLRLAQYALGRTLMELEDDEEDASIPAWNDAPGRTQTEVLELFDHAIARLNQH